MKIYKSSNSNEVNIKTVLFLLFAVFITLSFSWMGYSYLSIILRFVFIILMLLIILLIYSKSLKYIKIENHQLTIERKLSSIFIPLENITKVERVAYQPLQLNLGSQGIFGYTGKSRDQNQVLVNDLRTMVKIETKTKNYLISCDFPDKMTDYLNSKIELFKLNNPEKI